MKMFMSATDSSAVIGHKWATRPTVIMRVELVGKKGPFSPSRTAQIVQKPSATSLTVLESNGKGAGYKLEICPSVPTTATIPTDNDKKQGKVMNKSRDSDNVAAIFGSGDSLSSAKSISFHTGEKRSSLARLKHIDTQRR